MDATKCILLLVLRDSKYCTLYTLSERNRFFLTLLLRNLAVI